MKVILELDEMVLKKLAEKAALEKRSRKNYMELILQGIAEDCVLFTQKQADEPLKSKTDDDIPDWKKRYQEYKQQNKIV